MSTDSFGTTSQLRTACHSNPKHPRENTVPDSRKRARENPKVVCATYFDVLPFEVVEKIIRFMSSSPDEHVWAHDIEFDDAISLLSAHGAIALVAQRLFRSVIITARNMPHHNNPNGVVVEVGPNGHRLQYLLANMKMEHLLLRTPTYAARYWFQIDSHLSHLRTLTIRSELFWARRDENVRAVARLIHACSATLENLTLRTYDLETPVIQALQAHCSQLKKLVLFNCKLSGRLGALWNALAAGQVFQQLECDSLKIKSGAEPLELFGWENLKTLSRLSSMRLLKISPDNWMPDQETWDFACVVQKPSKGQD